MLVKTGDMETAAEAECVLAQMAFETRDAPGVNRHIGRAAEFVRGRPPSAAHAWALSQAARFQMLGGEWRDAVESGREAERMATALGLDAIRAETLVTIGTARADLGDPRGRADLEAAIELAEAANAPQVLVRALNNLSWKFQGIDMRKARELNERQYETARRYGHMRHTWWARIQLVRTAFETGRWDEALEHAEAVIAHVEAGNPLYAEADCRLVRAAITFARGDVGAFDAEIHRALALAAEATDPQAKGPISVYAAYLRLWAGDRRARGSSSIRRSRPRLRARSGSASSTTRQRFCQRSWSAIRQSLRYRTSVSPKHRDNVPPLRCSKAISSAQPTRSKNSGR